MTERERLTRDVAERERQWRDTFHRGDTTERLRRWRALDQARARLAKEDG